MENIIPAPLCVLYSNVSVNITHAMWWFQGTSRDLCGLHFRTGVSGEGTAVFVHKRYSGTAAVDDAAFHWRAERVVRALLSRSAFDTLGIT